MLLKGERHRRIQSIITKSGRVTVTELSRLFQVSETTIRRDLEMMEGLGHIQREHGGAITTEHVVLQSPVLQRTNDQSEYKRRIGQAAAQLIRENDTIFISSGSTALEVARNIPKLTNLTVITNALNVANELVSRTNITVVLVGGTLRASELSLVGHITEQALRDLRADKLFLGMRAVSIEEGLTNDYLPEITTDRAILAMAGHVILVADHSKFGRVSTSRVAPITVIGTVVTDNQVSEDILRQLEALNIQVILA